MTTTKRTDVHRPAELQTEHYQYAGSFDSNPTAGMTIEYGQFGEKSVSYGPEAAQARRMEKLLEEHGWKGHRPGQCDHCGNVIRYVAVLKHKPTGDYVQVGEQCLENRFEQSTADFRAMKKHAEEARAEQRIKKAVTAFVETNPDLAWMAEKETPAEFAGSFFLVDVARKLRNYGEVSDRQVAAVRTAMGREAEFQAKKRQQDAERAARDAVRPHAPVPTGRVQVTGEVFKVKDPEPYDRFPQTKMLVSDDRGFRVWGSVPRAIWNVRRGDRVQFTAEVEASKDDPEFGFFRRPTQAQVLEAPAAAPEPEVQPARDAVAVAQYDDDDRAYDAWVQAGGRHFPPPASTGWSANPVERLQLAVSEAAKALQQAEANGTDDEYQWQAYRAARRALREAEADAAAGK